MKGVSCLAIALVLFSCHGWLGTVVRASPTCKGTPQFSTTYAEGKCYRMYALANSSADCAAAFWCGVSGGSVDYADAYAACPQYYALIDESFSIAGGTLQTFPYSPNCTGWNVSVMLAVAQCDVLRPECNGYSTWIVRDYASSHPSSGCSIKENGLFLSLIRLFLHA